MNKGIFRILHRFVAPYKKYVVLSIFFHILSAILNLFSFAVIIPILNILFKINETTYQCIPWNFPPASWEAFREFPYVLQNNFFYFINQLIETRGGEYTLVTLGLFLILMTFFKVSAMYLATAAMIPIRTGVVRDIRNQINIKITQLPLSFFSEERKGDIIARASGDVNEIETSIVSSLDMLLKNPILILVYLAGMFFINWQLTLFVFVLLPLAGYLMGWVGRQLKRTSLAGQHQWGLLISRIEETLSGLRVVKAFNAESYIHQRFEGENEVFRKLTNRIFLRQQLAHPMSEFLGTVAIAVVLWYGGSLILTDDPDINASTFIYYLVIFYSIINPAKDLSRASYAIQKGLASVERVDKILHATSTINDPVLPQPITLNDYIIYDNVSFRYDNDWVLRNISLTIPKGHTVALVGQSGSGKTTLVDLLPRFYDVTQGCIRIDGTDIRDATLHDLRRLMGNVNQDPILFNDTFFNNIAFGTPDASQQQVEEAARIANAHDFIVATVKGYGTNIGDRGAKLSGGQRQRISIARAILKNPPILILDEATSALDTESERLVQDALEKLMRNRTTLIIAHRLSTIRNANLICVLHEGQIVERGRHDDLLHLGGYYKKLCDMQRF
ncbi:MAG: ABC transporter ATP-binding protein/permease [Tannerellaceae bacterium]|jgi:ATP-binding cassette subfamily B protein/subfamily B ATP-binding cassette protein MsbA|nr:ABC transporter ATP-binding protein/permease [Tannerellaceae bacterium]